MEKAAYIASKLPDQPNLLPSIRESSVSVAAEREEAFCSRPSFSELDHGGFLHQLLAQASSSRQRSQRSPATATASTDHDHAVVGRAAPGVHGGRGVRRDRDGGRRRRRGRGCAERRGGRRRRRRGRGRAGAAAVERPEGVPAVARQLPGEHRAGEPAPPVGAPQAQQHRGAGEGPCPRARSGGALPGAALRPGQLLPLGK